VAAGFPLITTNREEIMNVWKNTKRWFDTWESATAELMETWMKSPVVLEPAGAWLSAMMRAKAASDDAVAKSWGMLGLPTKRDQERTLHALNQLQSRLIDLQEQLADTQAELAREREHRHTHGAAD
jgi:hypothetical protein